MYHFSVYTLSLFVLCLSGCGGDGNGGKDQDGTGDTSTSTVPEDCAQYLECLAVVDAGNMDLYEATYGEDGECWSGSSSDQLTCTQACQVGMESAAAANPGIEECWIEDTPDMLLVFGFSEPWNWQGDCSEFTHVQTVFSAAASGSEFLLSFFSDETESWPNNDILFNCIESGWSFDCESDRYLWWLSGTFSDGFEAGVLESTFTTDDGDVTCSWTGTPS